jgi:ABC-type spermidine/putrescine transport system permease subunit I
MRTVYTAAITTVVMLVIGLTAMVAYVLSRPSDLAPRA